MGNDRSAAGAGARAGQQTGERIASLVQQLLIELGENPARQGLARTPARVARSLAFLTEGYDADPAAILRSATFEEDNDEMVVVRDIDIFSLCEHHLLPFYGKCHVAYVPRGRIVGLSKIPRVVNAFSRRLQVQERLTEQIARCVEDALQPHGVAVVIEALHLCMAMRGVEKQNSQAVTSSMRGIFRTDRGTRMEFLNFIRKA